jgi:chromosome segregation ATPase
LSQLHSELGKLRNTGRTKTSETVRQLEDLRGQFKVLNYNYEAAQLEASRKAMVESKLATVIADLDAAKLKITGYEKESVNLAQEIKECNTALLQSRDAGEHLKSQLEGLQRQSDACNSDLRRQLSQAEGKAKYAEAGLDQMRSSAEKTISEEQEKHRKQREALQKRLDESQTELQMKSAEADDTRAFVERTVRHQQEAWEKSYTDLESKVAEHRLSSELTSKKLSDVQTERDTVQTQLKHLQIELQQQQQSDSHRRAREANNQGNIDDLRKQHEAAQKEIARLQAVKNQHDRLVDEYEAREKTSNEFVDESRKECDSAKSPIATLQAVERQRVSDDVTRKAQNMDMQSKMEDLLTELDAANAALRTLRAAIDHRQDNDQVTSEPAYRPTTDRIVPPKVSEYLAPVKQRRKADRNTNTIVTEASRNEPQATELRATLTQTPVVTPAPTTLAETSEHDISTRPSLHYENSSSRHQKNRLPPTSGFLENGGLWDSRITPAVAGKAPNTRLFGSSMQTSSTLNEAGLPKIASHSSQALAIPLDFSGKPRVSEGRSFGDDEPSAIPSQVSHSSGFQIYEDSQPLVSDGQFEEESVRENFTFRKPFPPSNSASKRITRRTSDKSLEGRVAPSLGTQRQPDKTGNSVLSQSDKTPETSKYPFGSSPEFMNPPSNKVKRQYSGSSRPGSSGQAIARPPSSPMPDPRLVAKAGAAKRGALQDSQQTEEEPPTKRRTTPAATKAVRRRTTDEGLPARSSQSVKDLPRVEDMNAARNIGKPQSSHMRSSGVSTRTTRNSAKASKGNLHIDIAA